MLKHASRLSLQQQSMLINMFAIGSTAGDAAVISNVNRSTANLRFRHFREIIYKATPSIPRFTGDVEIDHAYFGGPQKRNGEKGSHSWSANKVIVLGIYDRNLKGGTLYTQIIPDVKSSTILPIIRRVVDKSATIHTDSWRGFKQLAKEGYQCFSVNHSAEVYYDKNTDSHTGHVDAFWGRAKLEYQKRGGVPESTFSLFLKEQEFIYNHRFLKDKKLQKEEDCFPFVFQKILKKYSR